MVTFNTLPYTICLLLMLLAGIIDVKTRKIPNYITFPAFGIGIVLTFFINGIYSLIPVLLFTVFMFGISIFGIMGLGDVKLLIAESSLVGVFNALLTLSIGSIAVVVIYFLTKPKMMESEVRLGLINLSTGNWKGVFDGKTIPMAPFLLIGFIGATIIDFLGVISR